MSNTNPVVFIRDGFITWDLVIPASAPDVRIAAGAHSIHFSHDANTGMDKPKCTFATTNTVLIKYLNDWNKKRRKLKTDMSSIPMSCPQCDFKTPGGASTDLQLLHSHILESHSDIVEEANTEPSEAAEGDAGDKYDNPDDFKLAELKSHAEAAGVPEEVFGPLTRKADVIAEIRKAASE